MDEVETAKYITIMDNVLNSVYAFHVRTKVMELTQHNEEREHHNICLERTKRFEFIEELNHNFENIINEINDGDVIKDWMSELKHMKIPETIKYMYSLKIRCIDWCETELKTDKWKNKIYKMTKSMLLVEDWFIKKQCL